jgi:hypothetical protein
MAALATSARLFAIGIARRVWWLIAVVIVGNATVYDAAIKPYLPPDWQKVAVAVPLPIALAFLLCGVAWAAVLTYHELRTSTTAAPRVSVSGGIYMHHVESVTYGSGRATSVKVKRKPSPDQETFWTTREDQP